MFQLHGRARFLNAEDGHQADMQAIFADQRVDELLFLEPALTVFVGAAMLPGKFLSICD